MKWIGGVFTFSFILFMSSWFAQSAIANSSTDFVVKMAETKSAQSLKSSGMLLRLFHLSLLFRSFISRLL